MLKAIALFVVGLILICVGGDRLVDASVAIAKKLGIPHIVVGATIVSIGTTLPEVLVSTTAAFQGSADICAGNAFGSIICNTALIAGLTQTIRPTKKVEAGSFNWRTVFFMVTILALIAYGFVFGRYDRIAGIALLLGFALYAFLSIRLAGNSEEEENNQDKGEVNLLKQLVILVVCAALLYVGAKLLVDNGILIAEGLHVPERVIAVTFIALGTSLPELVTSLMSLIKGYGNVGLGNIIGANLLNLLLVIGIPASLTGIQLADQTIRVDAPMGVVVMLLLTAPLFVKKRAYRWQGILLLLVYAGYCIASYSMV